jgi:hypothetical protein
MEIGEAQKLCFQAAKDCWLSQVDDKWDYFMFKQAHNWEDLKTPEEVKMKLAGIHMAEENTCGRSWLSLLSLGDRDEF